MKKLLFTVLFLGLPAFTWAQDSLRLTIHLEGFKKSDKVYLHFNEQNYILSTDRDSLSHTNYVAVPHAAYVTYKKTDHEWWIENGDITLSISKENFKSGVMVSGSKSEELHQAMKKANRAERASLIEANIDHPLAQSYMKAPRPDLHAEDIKRIRQKMPDHVNEHARYHVWGINIKKDEVLKEGDRIMDFVAQTSKDKVVDTKSFRGKFLLLDFGSTTCGYCWKAYPAMAEELMHYEDLQVLTINKDYRVEVWEKHARKREIFLPWPVLWKAENKREIFEKYGINVLPTYVLISPEGEILEYWRVGNDKKFSKMLEKHGVVKRQM